MDFPPDNPVPLDGFDNPPLDLPDDSVPLSGTTPDKLPQTGQLWWPVPLLVIVGLALMILGLRGRRRAK